MPGSSALFGGSFDVVSDGSGNSSGGFVRGREQRREAKSPAWLPVARLIPQWKVAALSVCSEQFLAIGRVLSPQAAARRAALSPEVEDAQQYSA